MTLPSNCISVISWLFLVATFLIYQFVLRSSIYHLFCLQACVCHTLDCDVPPHNHSKNNLCQRIFYCLDQLEKSLLNIFRRTYSELAADIQDPTLPASHLFLAWSVFSYAAKRLHAKVDEPSFLLTGPKLPNGLTLAPPISESDISTMKNFFRRARATGTRARLVS